MPISKPRPFAKSRPEPRSLDLPGLGLLDKLGCIISYTCKLPYAVQQNKESFELRNCFNNNPEAGLVFFRVPGPSWPNT